MNRIVWSGGLVVLATLLGASGYVSAHDPITTTITWNREISRVFNQRCEVCHSKTGGAFPLTSYAEARPWAVAIKEEVLSRRMPPWGALKGFGEFRNDQGLTSEQIEMITSWVEGGVPEGDLKDLPTAAIVPEPWPKPPSARDLRSAIRIDGAYTLRSTLRLDGIFPGDLAAGATVQMVAEGPAIGVVPLLWLYEYQPDFRHPFLYRKPLTLPAGTTIRGVMPGMQIQLLPK